MSSCLSVVFELASVYRQDAEIKLLSEVLFISAYSY